MGLMRYARSFYQLLGNRRKFERTPFAGTILLTCKGAIMETTHVCTCVDIAPRGIGVESSEALPLGGFVQVHSDEYGPRRMARVRYCVEKDGRHRAGLEFIAETQ